MLHKARNLAIKKTKGKFIAFLDVDDLWSKDKLALQIPKFKNKKIGLVYSNFYKYYNLDKKKLHIKVDCQKENNKFNNKKIIKLESLLLLSAKSCLNKKMPFDFRYDLLSDYDFGLNFSLKHEFDVVNKPLAFYRIHKNQIQKRNMVLQAEQFCKWFSNKKIKKKIQRLRYFINTKKI